MAPRRALSWVFRGVLAFGTLFAIAVLAAPLWLRPLLEWQASKALARPVTIGHLQWYASNGLGFTAEGVGVGNPPDFPAGAAPFATLGRVTITLDVLGSLRRRSFLLARVELERPDMHLLAIEGGRANFRFDSPNASLLVVEGFCVNLGRAHVSLQDLRADFDVEFATAKTTSDRSAGQFTADAQGSIAGEPLMARLTGEMPAVGQGKIQSWNIDFDIRNGPTHVAGLGTLRYANGLPSTELDLSLMGPDMATLRWLTGISFPATPPYDLRGRFHQESGRYSFRETTGRLGRSDIAGNLTVVTGGARPIITAELQSREVEPTDILSILGGHPASSGTPGQPRLNVTKRCR